MDSRFRRLRIPGWRSTWLRLFIRYQTRYLARVGAMNVGVLGYIEELQARLDSQERELGRLRKDRANARIADLESDQDCREWAGRMGIDPGKAEKLLKELGLESKRIKVWMAEVPASTPPWQ